MEFKNIIINKANAICTITFNRPSSNNSINSEFLIELNEALDFAERDSECKIVALEGQGGFFCTGMDLQEYSKEELFSQSNDQSPFTKFYMDTLRRLSMMPQIIIAKIDGQVMAGGVGFVAASDYAIATESSQFTLSEALWGLIPAMVTPYLIRRVGFQKAYLMTLTTFPQMAQDALNINLIDEISDNPNDSIRKLSTRLCRINNQTIKDIKQYFRKMWIVTEEMEKTAITEITRLVASPIVKENIDNYVKYKKFPWNK